MVGAVLARVLAPLSLFRLAKIMQNCRFSVRLRGAMASPRWCGGFLRLSPLWWRVHVFAVGIWCRKNRGQIDIFGFTGTDFSNRLILDHLRRSWVHLRRSWADVGSSWAALGPGTRDNLLDFAPLRCFSSISTKTSRSSSISMKNTVF